jgi:proteasome lid subunit RPN8/RPN11
MAELDGSVTVIALTENHWKSMLEDVQQRYPEEACGLLGGRANKVYVVAPITNALRSSFRYLMDPVEQLSVFEHFESQGLELIGIYHSHPAGPAQPSKTDIEEAYYPESAYLIWSEASGKWECHAFRIKDGAFHELEINLAPD